MTWWKIDQIPRDINLRTNAEFDQTVLVFSRTDRDLDLEQRRLEARAQSGFWKKNTYIKELAKYDWSQGKQMQLSQEYKY